MTNEVMKSVGKKRVGALDTNISIFLLNIILGAVFMANVSFT